MIKRYVLAVALVWVVLEVTAALWHLLFFRAFYVDQMRLVERPFEEYIIPHLMLTNLLRAAALTSFWALFVRRAGAGSRDGWKFGGWVGLICGLMVAEYYGTWQLKSLAWPVVEGVWAVLQGLAVGATLGVLIRADQVSGPRAAD